MSVSDDLTSVAAFCNTCAQTDLSLMLGMGPRPGNEAQGLLWDQQVTRLQGQINSLIALVTKLTALSVVAGLENYATQINDVSVITKRADARIKAIDDISKALSKIAKVLDLGLAIVAAAAAPSPSSIAAVVAAGTAVDKDV